MYSNPHWATFGPWRSLKEVNLNQNIREEKDLSAQHPEMVRELQQVAEQAREELGGMRRSGKAIWPAAIIE